VAGWEGQMRSALEGAAVRVRTEKRSHTFVHRDQRKKPCPKKHYRPCDTLVPLHASAAGALALQLAQGHA
jgi:hypothetical protein